MNLRTNGSTAQVHCHHVVATFASGLSAGGYDDLDIDDDDEEDEDDAATWLKTKRDPRLEIEFLKQGRLG